MSEWLGQQFGIVVSSNVWTVRYDIAEIQAEERARFEIDELPEQSFVTDELSLGDQISVQIAEHVIDELGAETVYGFIVPDHLLGSFISSFPSYRIYRQ